MVHSVYRIDYVECHPCSVIEPRFTPRSTISFVRVVGDSHGIVEHPSTEGLRAYDDATAWRSRIRNGNEYCPVEHQQSEKLSGPDRHSDKISWR